MKKLILVVALLGLSFISCKNETKDPMETDNSVATDSIVVEETDTVETPMDSVAMQKAWEAYMTPGEPHKMMAAEEGTWNNEMTFWMGHGSEATKATSTAEIKMILGGRYQEANYKGDMMGMPFEGRATIAYDNNTKEIVSTWIDNMGTGMMVMRGTYDDATKTIKSKGTMVDPMTGKERKVREVYTIVDDNTRKMEMFETLEGGEEYKSMEILMKRA
ncbi:MAG TPA: DUF1579 domain-containing protein [Aequorivita sp.]|nr:DUF1579 domain-containing protein [Aequorivita sp.]